MMEAKYDGLETLRKGTLRYIEMLDDMDKTYSAILSERYEKRGMELAGSGVPCNSEGESMVDPSDFYQGIDKQAFDESFDPEVLYQRALLTLLHHALEVFKKAAAVVGHSVIGGPRPKIKELSSLHDWYVKQGIHLKVIPGFDLLRSPSGTESIA